MGSAPNRRSTGRARGRGVVVGTFGAAAAVLLATAAMAARGAVTTAEEPSFRFVNGLPRPAGWVLEPPMHLASAVGMSILVVAALAARRPRVAGGLAVAWFVARTVSGVAKGWVDRGRPPLLIADVTLRQRLPTDPGYPSAHAAVAAGVAIVVAWAWPRLRWVVALWAFLVGFARVYVGVHLPLDVIGGWAVGVLVGTATVAAVERVPVTVADGRIALARTRARWP